jgi:putative endonuclease
VTDTRQGPADTRFPVVPAQAGTHGATAPTFWVYLLSSKPHGTLYVGMTRDLVRRVWEHKIKAIPGFTTTYGIDGLVWFEAHASLESAFARERQIKEWKRAWKIQLIEAGNPHWIDLYPALSP